MNPLLDRLPELQLAQMRHDELAHRDILCLPVQDRLKHMVLHFAKYCGHLADMQESKNSTRLPLILVDAFIITLASANTLNLRLSEKILQSPETVWDLPNKSLSYAEISAYLFPKLTRICGTMAKACESLDHLEEFNYRETLEQGLVAIAALLLATARSGKFDLLQAVKDRWITIENKVSTYSKSTAPVIRNPLRIAGNDS